MNILICSDGTPPSKDAMEVGGLLASAVEADTTLLGIAERAEDTQPLRQSLDQQAAGLRQLGLNPRVAMRSGEPTRQILAETTTSSYDLVAIGARHKETTGLFWRSRRTYELVKAIVPPVLVALGKRERLRRFLLCTGGKHYIDKAVRLTGHFASALKAEVTLLHVMAEPPPIFANLARLENEATALLASRSDFARTLSLQKAALEKLGVSVQLRLRHGLVIEEVFNELAEGDYDVIVSGSGTRTPLRHYIMGDVTRSILNRAQCPVLVARSDKDAAAGFLRRLTKGRLGSGF